MPSDIMKVREIMTCLDNCLKKVPLFILINIIKIPFCTKKQKNEYKMLLVSNILYNFADKM